jgi:hypothetical protein
LTLGEAARIIREAVKDKSYRKRMSRSSWNFATAVPV